MVQLTPEQSAQLSSAVRRARRAEVCEAVENVYRALADAIELRRPICQTSGRCCRFESFGHSLFVTTMELAAFTSKLPGHLPPAGIKDWDGSGCPFQVGGLCGVHAIRPFGCRIFFCDETSTDWQREQYERLHAELKRLHAVHEVDYFYVEWRQALSALNYGSDRGAPLAAPLKP